jgi:ribosomal protein S6
MTALQPKVKLLQVTQTVKDIASHALANGGSFLDLEDRGIRRAWHPMRGTGQGGPQDQARFFNLTCFVKPTTLKEMEEKLRKESNTLRVRSTLVADTPYEMILEKRAEEERARLQVYFQMLDSMPIGDHRDKFKKSLMNIVAERKKSRFDGHRFSYDTEEE